MPSRQSALEAYLMRGDFVVRGDKQTIWLEGAPNYKGPLPTDSPEGRLILCEAPYWGDDGDDVAFILERIQAALTVCQTTSTEELIQKAHLPSGEEV